MKDTTIKQIANRLNVSKTTVSRAIRHCSGVDSMTRHSLLQERQRMNYHSDEKCAIYVILPDIPQYFWKELKNGIIAGEQPSIASIKYNVYTRLRDEMAVLEYLDEAEHLNSTVIIIAAHMTPSIHQKLSALSKKQLIIFLSEYHELTNGFYVGSNAYEDGYTMGKQYISHYADRRLVCVTVPNNNATYRINGFHQAIRELKPQLLEREISITLDQTLFLNLKLLPSKLAPLLTEMINNDEHICIYSPIGIPQLPLALIKAKLTEKTVCICHDCYTEHPHDGKNIGMGFAITCNQDLRKQGYVAVKIATNFVKEHLYPEQKKIYIPSILGD